MFDSKSSKCLLMNDSLCHTFFDRLKRLIHWAPLVALFIIFFIAIITTNCIIHIFHPLSNVICFIHFSIYVYEFYLVVNNYLNASFIGPGFVKLGWKPKLDTDKQYLQYCELCEGYKPPRSHHCRKCDRCVMKMDHHCPWINTCCGHLNHGYFVYFLFFAPIGCIHSTYILGLTLYYAIYVDYFFNFDDRFVVILSLMEFLCSFFAAGLAIGVVIAVGSLWIIQMRSIMKNETGVESWIKEKAQLRVQESENEQQFVYPYDLGRMRNMKEILTWSGRCRGDGVSWTVRDGCGQFDLTIEQIKQKRDKVLHSQNYEIKRSYNGGLCPVFSFGCRVVYGSPCSDENRLAVTPGQIVMVTRWRKHWLYGQIMFPVGSRSGSAGGSRSTGGGSGSAGGGSGSAGGGSGSAGGGSGSTGGGSGSAGGGSGSASHSKSNSQSSTSTSSSETDSAAAAVALQHSARTTRVKSRGWFPAVCARQHLSEDHRGTLGTQKKADRNGNFQGNSSQHAKSD